MTDVASALVADLGDAALSRLQTRHFPRNACLMREGERAEAAFFIVSGEVRVEVERPDLDTDGVVSYMQPGSVCGEFALLDDRPRSASAYAHTDVVARVLTAEALDELCREDPATGLSVLRTLSQHAAHKAREYSKHLEEFVFAGERDPRTDALVAASRAAQQRFAAWPGDAVDALLADAAEVVAEHAEELATDTVAETGLGSVADKSAKNRFASLDVAAWLEGRPGPGVVAGADERGLVQVADPVGVVLGLIPMTNPVATLVFKALICWKAGNSLIVSCHRDAGGVAARTVDLLRGVLARHGAPLDLVQDVRPRTTRRMTAALMSHPDVALILATGGAAMVRAAYSSGTPAIGVGSGNAPVWVCADADPVRAAQLVVDGKSFDHGIICGSENNLVVDRAIRTAFVAGLHDAGAAVLAGEAVDALERVAFDEHGRLRRSVLGQAAPVIAELAGIAVPPGTRLLVLEVPREASGGPLGREKLAPLLTLFVADDDEDGLQLCRLLLGNGGDGHTAIIHSPSAARQTAFARHMPASRILANTPGAQGCIGLGNGLTPSLTLGCGTYGNNSTTDNVTYTHLMNIKRLAHPV